MKRKQGQIKELSATKGRLPQEATNEGKDRQEKAGKERTGQDRKDKSWTR
jgi:hypothetical protein